MGRALTRAQVRELDRRAIEAFGVPGVVLMENAGRGVAELLLSLGINGPVMVACGKGNNGGDGFVIARHLHNHGCDVRVHFFANCDKLRGDALTNFRILEKSRPFPALRVHADVDFGGLSAELARADWIVDALFGTGLRAPIGPPIDGVIDLINKSGKKVLAVDVPSGLDCDTGNAMGRTIRATHTATFVALKAGFLHPGSAQWTGKVHVLDIGVPRQLVETM